VVNGRSYQLVEEGEPSGEPLDGAAIDRLLRPPPKRRLLAASPPAGDLAGLVGWLAQQTGEGNQNAALWWAAKQAIRNGASDTDLHRLVDVYVSLSIPGHPRGPNTQRAGWQTVNSARRSVEGAR
jgi:hypothetical protein